MLAEYPLWKYELSVFLGRGARYAALAGLGLALPIPGQWIVLGSLVILILATRSARRMNRSAPAESIIATSEEV